MSQWPTSARSSLIRSTVGRDLSITAPLSWMFWLHFCSAVETCCPSFHSSVDSDCWLYVDHFARIIIIVPTTENKMFHGTRRKMFSACCSQKAYRGKNAARSEVLPGVMLRLSCFFLYSFDFSTSLYVILQQNHVETVSFRSNPENNRGMQHLYKDLHKIRSFLCVCWLFTPHMRSETKQTEVLKSWFSALAWRCLHPHKTQNRLLQIKLSSSIFGCSAGRHCCCCRFLQAVAALCIQSSSQQ